MTAPIENPAPAVFTGGSAHDYRQGYDQVAFDFSPGAPQCELRYVDPPITNEQTGATVAVAGAAFLQVHCREVTGVDPASRFDTEPGAELYSRRAPMNVTEIVQTGFNGSALTVTIGLQRRTPFIAGSTGAGGSLGATILVSVTQ
jgi:hypothetical protein